MEPNLAGFVSAQDALREKFGEAVVLTVPLPETWPAGARLDPETGRPYDPTIQPVSSGVAQAAFTAIVMDQTDLAAEQQERATAVGDMGEWDLVLDVHPDDYPDASAATRAVVRGDTFAVTRWHPDGVRGIDRYLAFLEEMR